MNMLIVLPPDGGSSTVKRYIQKSYNTYIMLYHWVGMGRWWWLRKLLDLGVEDTLGEDLLGNLRTHISISWL